MESMASISSGRTVLVYSVAGSINQRFIFHDAEEKVLFHPLFSGGKRGDGSMRCGEAAIEGIQPKMSWMASITMPVPIVISKISPATRTYRCP
jgi:hypothetical protein